MGAVTGSGSALALIYAFAKKFGSMETRVNDLWQMRDDLQGAILKADTIWRTLVEPRIMENQERGRIMSSSYRISPDTEHLLGALRPRIDEIMGTRSLVILSEPVPFVIDRLGLDAVKEAAKAASMGLEEFIAFIHVYVHQQQRELKEEYALNVPHQSNRRLWPFGRKAKA